MYDSALTSFSLWWIIPVIIMVLCFLMMRGCKASMMCGFGPSSIENYQAGNSDSTMEILDRRDASGEIDKNEYEEKKSALKQASETEKSMK
jgi:uncharacterized membrane protein